MADLCCGDQGAGGLLGGPRRGPAAPGRPGDPGPTRSTSRPSRGISATRWTPCWATSSRTPRTGWRSACRSGWRPGRRPWVEVADKGPGMPGHDVVERGRSVSGSTGLGLDIARRVAERGGGSIVVGTPTAGPGRLRSRPAARWLRPTPARHSDPISSTGRPVGLGLARADQGSSGSIATARNSSDRYVIDPWNRRIARGSRAPAMHPAAQTVGLAEEGAAEQHRADRVEPAHPGDRREQQRGHDHGPRVAHDRRADRPIIGNRGQHGHLGGLVVGAEPQCQRPVVRRRPEEDDAEQHEGRPVQRAGHRRPADEHGDAARGAAPDDVLGGPPLEQHRVDQHVERDRHPGQHSGQHVHGHAQQQHRQRAEHQPEDERGPRRDLPDDQRPTTGAHHEGVDVTVVDLVDHVGAGRSHGAAEQGEQHGRQRRHATRCEEHHRDGRDQQQLDDPGLGQRQVRPPAGYRRAIDRDPAGLHCRHGGHGTGLDRMSRGPRYPCARSVPIRPLVAQ